MRELYSNRTHCPSVCASPRRFRKTSVYVFRNEQPHRPRLSWFLVLTGFPVSGTGMYQSRRSIIHVRSKRRLATPPWSHGSVNGAVAPGEATFTSSSSTSAPMHVYLRSLAFAG